MHVYRMNEDEYWMGRTLSATIAAYKDMCGPDILDFYDEAPLQLDEQSMQHMRYRDEEGISRSFAEELAQRIAAGCTMECPFAGTEW